MNRSRQARWWPVLCAAGLLAVLPLAAQDSTGSPAQLQLPPNPASIIPPLPQQHSPVDFFRKLLAMTPVERANYLTNRTPEVRARILAKVREYQTLDPNERELRLRATELRWYLLPLLRESPTNRAASLALVSDDLHNLVQSRLEQWDALPRQSQQEFLANEQTLHYFSHLDATNNPPLSVDQSHWNALSEDERKKITDQFNQFFDLTPEEKQKALNTLSEAERAQMDKTLQAFNGLPLAQRRQCVRAFTQFAGMSQPDRAEFLKNAERWSQMTPKERQAWRDLVSQVPIWPPLPNALIRPPMPPVPQPPGQSPPRTRPLVATNHN